MNDLISIIIPAKNEALGIDRIVDAVFDKVSGEGFIPQIIIVDDGSTDDTYVKAVEIARRMGGVRILRLSRNFGKEAAIAAGLVNSEGTAIMVIDADFQHPVDKIPSMLQAWREGYEIVEAVKVNRGRERLFSRLSSLIFYFLFRFFSRFDISQATDFKLIDRKVVDYWKKMQERHLFFRGMIAWLGFRRKQIPIEIRERIEGGSRWSTIHLFRYALKNIISFSPFLLYVSSLGTLVLSILTVLIALRAVLVKLSGQVLDGITIIILTQSIIGTGLMLGMSVISIYLSLIFEEMKKRPRFVIAESFPPSTEDGKG